MPRTDIFDERESWPRPLGVAVGLHASVVGLLVLYSAVNASRAEKWGDPKSLGGGAVGITSVAKIPLPAKIGRRNPVANDTESQVPSAPVKPQPQTRTPLPDPKAILLKSRNAPKQAPKPTTSRYSPVKEPKPNQVYSSTGQQMTSPMFSQAAGGGGVGSGSNSPFGNRFGWYEALLREKVARNWRSQDLSSSIRSPVIVTFELLRNGTVRNVRVTRSSSNFTLDQSAQRAILASSPFQPLPPQYERDSALIDFTFQLQQ
jgi:protein TonB